MHMTRAAGCSMRKAMSHNTERKAFPCQTSVSLKVTKLWVVPFVLSNVNV